MEVREFLSNVYYVISDIVCFPFILIGAIFMYFADEVRE